MLNHCRSFEFFFFFFLPCTTAFFLIYLSSSASQKSVIVFNSLSVNGKLCWVQCNEATSTLPSCFSFIIIFAQQTPLEEIRRSRLCSMKRKRRVEFGRQAEFFLFFPLLLSFFERWVRELDTTISVWSSINEKFTRASWKLTPSLYLLKWVFISFFWVYTVSFKRWKKKKNYSCALYTVCLSLV